MNPMNTRMAIIAALDFLENDVEFNSALDEAVGLDGISVLEDGSIEFSVGGKTITVSASDLGMDAEEAVAPMDGEPVAPGEVA